MQQVSLVQQSEPIAQALCFVQAMRADDHGLVLPAKMPDVRCSGAVILGRLGELDQQPEPFFDNKVCLTALEAVREISEVEGRRVFKRLGKTAQYVNLI